MDLNYLLMLQNFREATGGVLNTFFEYITKLGETSVLLLPLGIIYWGVDKKKGIFVMFTLFINRIINGFVKITACAYRPWIRDSRITPVPEAKADATGYSFPSGHTTNAVSVWGGLSMNIEGSPKCPKVLQIIMWVLVLLIAFSRNYLGVHTPQDVVVALVLSIAVLILTAKLMPLIDKKPNADMCVALGGTALCLLLILYAALKSYPVDYAADGSVVVEGSKMAVDSYKNAGMGIGFFIGWLIERRLIKFSTENSSVVNVIRAVFCVFTYTIFDNFSGSAASALTGLGLGSSLSKALVQFALIFYFVAIGPAIVKLFENIFQKTKKA